MTAGILLLTVSGFMGTANVGAEAALDSYGWWYKPNQVPDNLAAPPAPPGVPSDGLYIAADPSGPFALAAVRYIADGPGVLTLSLAPEGQSGPPSIAACMALTTWDGSSAGRWDGIPEYDCASQVEGALSEDGTSMTWALTPTLQRVSGTYDLALVPLGPVPFGTSFEAPQGSSLVTFGGEDDPFAPTSESPTYQEPAGFEGGGQAGDFGSFDTTFPDVDESRTSNSGAGEPAPPPTSDLPVSSGVQPVAVTRPLVLPDDRNERMAAVAGLALLLLGAWWFGGRTVRPPRLLGSVAGRARALETSTEAAPSAPVRGIGRFARPRSS